jgi:hypothetical protein
MKLAAVLSSVVLLFTIPSMAQAANLFAGPVFGGDGDSCACELANISTSNKTNIKIEMFDRTGALKATVGPFSLAAGASAFLNSTTDDGTSPVYCKFTNVSATAFRAIVGCFTGVASDFVAVPGR